jgi:uncharacterized protein (DUF58 family)
VNPLAQLLHVLRNPPPLRATVIFGTLVRTYEERLTTRGRYLFWATLAFGIIGVDTRRSQAFLLFAVCASALLLAFFLNVGRRPPLALACALPLRATAGRPVSVTASLEGPAGRGVRSLHVKLPRPIRWGSSLQITPAEQLLDVKPKQTARATFQLLPKRRGRYLMRGATVRRTDPIGLASGRPLKAPDQTLLVYPRYWSLADFSVPAGRRYQPGGIPLSSSTGDAIEFVGTREYREGDSLRNIHWRSWARRGEPVVKEHQEEYFCRIALILDTFQPKRSTPEHERSFEAAISVLASIADYYSRSEYIVDILAAGPEIYEVSAGRSLAYLENVLDVLACLEPCHEFPFEKISPSLFDRLQRITSVVAVLQDWDQPREDFLRRVKGLGTAVRALVVREGGPSKDWRSLADELEISAMTPQEVETALQQGSVHD